MEQITNNELELIEEEGSARKPKPKYEDEQLNFRAPPNSFMP